MVIIILDVSFNWFKGTEDVIVLHAEGLKEAVITERVLPTASPTPRMFSNEIEAYIYQVFNEYGDRAMLLLKGNGVCSGENPKLNPKAVYTNTKGKYKGSRDRGIFQINDLFHPTMTDELAFNYKENIKYAYRMFKNDNYTFKRWSVGKCMGI